MLDVDKNEPNSFFFSSYRIHIISEIDVGLLERPEVQRPPVVALSVEECVRVGHDDAAAAAVAGSAYPAAVQQKKTFQFCFETWPSWVVGRREADNIYFLSSNFRERERDSKHAVIHSELRSNDNSPLFKTRTKVKQALFINVPLPRQYQLSCLCFN